MERQLSIWIGYGVGMLLYKFPNLDRKYKLPEIIIDEFESKLLKYHKIGKFINFSESSNPKANILDVTLLFFNYISKTKVKLEIFLKKNYPEKLKISL